MWLNPQFLTDLYTFTEEVIQRKLYLICGSGASLKLEIFQSGISLFHKMVIPFSFYYLRDAQFM